jgi:hypothetical protein
VADVFISYKSEDRDWAEKFDVLIRSAGYSTWWDSSLQPGERYNDRIDRELKAASAVVVIWSERSWISAWVKEEALFARDRDKLLPTRIDAVEVGVPFYSLQTIDFRGWEGASVSPSAQKLLESLKRQIPRTLREDYEVNVYWTRFAGAFTPDKEKMQRFFQRVVAYCSTIGVELKFVDAWNHIIYPNTIADRSIYEKDLNILLLIGSLKLDGLAEDIFCPGLRHLAAELNPYVIHIGNEEFSTEYLNFYCRPQRKIEIRGKFLPEADTVQGDSAIEALACFIAFRVLQVRSVMGRFQPAAQSTQSP